MSDFTFLTKEQCFGDNKLGVLKKRGTKAAITDFSVLLGAYVADYYHIDNDDSLEGRTGWYWTKSDNHTTDDVLVINEFGAIAGVVPHEREQGARIVLPFSSILNIPMNKESKKMVNDGILEVEYGYYPQKAVAKNMQEKLEIEYRCGTILKTKNSYTTDSVGYENYDKSFQPQIYREYEYNGKRYVRVKANSFFDGDNFILSNGEQYKDGDYVWVEVQPVKWLVDASAKVMITDKLIFSGIQFDEECQGTYYTENFDKTNIKKYIDKYFARDLLQTRTIGEQTNTSTAKKIKIHTL